MASPSQQTPSSTIPTTASPAQPSQPTSSSSQPQPPSSSTATTIANTAASNSAATSSSTQPAPSLPGSSSTAAAAIGAGASADPLTGDDIADADVDMLNPPPPGHATVLEEEDSASAADKDKELQKEKEKEKEIERRAPVIPGFAQDGGAESELAGIELKTTRKDRNLREFLNMMDEYAPIIPDAVTDYYLSLGGFSSTDPRIKRLLALATQKFIADIAADAYQYSRIRTSSSGASAFLPGGAGGGGIAGGGLAGGSGGGGMNFLTGFGSNSSKKGGRVVLTMEDLSAAVSEIGVNSKRPEFYR